MNLSHFPTSATYTTSQITLQNEKL